MPQPVRGPKDLADHVNALYQRIVRLERRKQSGFDPNENPVIIGSGATGSGGSTPSAPNSADANAVIIGANASVASQYAVAVGSGAAVVATSGGTVGVAVGANTTADDASVAMGTGATAGRYGNAFGNNALSSGLSSVAVGPGAQATATDAIALGDIAKALHANSIAIGATVNTSAANEIRIGTSTHTFIVAAGTVEFTGIPTTNPGVGSGQVWNNAGVLTVA